MFYSLSKCWVLRWVELDCKIIIKKKNISCSRIRLHCQTRAERGDFCRFWTPAHLKSRGRRRRDPAFVSAAWQARLWRGAPAPPPKQPSRWRKGHRPPRPSVFYCHANVMYSKLIFIWWVWLHALFSLPPWSPGVSPSVSPGSPLRPQDWQPTDKTLRLH